MIECFYSNSNSFDVSPKLSPKIQASHGGWMKLSFDGTKDASVHVLDKVLLARLVTYINDDHWSS